jgi:ribosomal protein L44E
MPNRNLNATELREIFNPLFEEVKSRLNQLSGGDAALLWALRRKLAKELSYLERGKPLDRKILKAIKRAEQGGKCAICSQDLPEQGAELDRFEAMLGYTATNTRLLCHDCHWKVQRERHFA